MEENRNYITGIIGALIGGLIATIPWIITYVYLNMMLSLLAIFIAAGALKGYQLFKGKIDKKLPMIITSISVLCVTLATLVIIPILLLSKNGLYIDSTNYLNLFQSKEFVGAIVRDFIIAIIFTFLGISGIIANLKKQLADGDTNIVINYNRPNPFISKESTDLIKEQFLKLNALDKTNTTTKEMVLNGIDLENKELIFNYMVNSGMIKKYQGNFYFCSKNYDHPVKRAFKIAAIVVITIIVLSVLIVILFDDEEPTRIEEPAQTIEENTYNVAKGYILVETDEDVEYYTPELDESGNSGYYSISTGTVENIETALNKIEKIALNAEGYVSHEKRVLTTKLGYKVYILETTLTDSINTIYYLTDESQYVLLVVTDYPNDEIDINDAALEVLGSVKLVDNK